MNIFPISETSFLKKNMGKTSLKTLESDNMCYLGQQNSIFMLTGDTVSTGEPLYLYFLYEELARKIL